MGRLFEEQLAREDEERRRLAEAELAAQVKRQQEAEQRQQAAEAERQLREREAAEAEERRRAAEAEQQRLFEEQLAREDEEIVEQRRRDEEAAVAEEEDAKQRLEDWLRQEKFTGVNDKRKSMMKSKFPLHSAVKRKDADTIQLLLRFGADPTSKDSNGLTAKDLAEKITSMVIWMPLCRLWPRCLSRVAQVVLKS